MIKLKTDFAYCQSLRPLTASNLFLESPSRLLKAKKRVQHLLRLCKRAFAQGRQKCNSVENGLKASKQTQVASAAPARQANLSMVCLAKQLVPATGSTRGGFLRFLTEAHTT